MDRIPPITNKMDRLNPTYVTVRPPSGGFSCVPTTSIDTSLAEAFGSLTPLYDGETLNRWTSVQ